MTTWQIVIAIIIVALSIVMPIYYSSQKKKKNEAKEILEYKNAGMTFLAKIPLFRAMSKQVRAFCKEFP